MAAAPTSSPVFLFALYKQEVAGVQVARRDVLQRNRVAAVGDHGIGTDLRHRGLHGGEIREHGVVELDMVRAVPEVGYGVVAEIRTEHEGIGAVSAGQDVLAVSATASVVAVAAVEVVVH